MTTPAGRDWPGFERLVAALHRRLDPGATIEWNQYLVGKSGRRRQLDIVVRGNVAGIPIIVAIECKDYSSPIGIGKVDEVVGKFEDVGANRGIMVARTRFTADAIDRAHREGIVTAVLRPATDEDWEGYLRSIHFRITSRVTVFDWIELTLGDGRVERVNQFEQLANAEDKTDFLDRILKSEMSNLPWVEGEPFRFKVQQGIRLLRDDEEPPIVEISFVAREVDGLTLDQIVVRPEDWIFYRLTPGGMIEEKQFLVFADLFEEAETFKALDRSPR